jgi:hypothetical protein
MVEIKVTIDSSAGAVVVRLGGVDEINVSGVDTQTTGNAYTNLVSFFNNLPAAVSDQALDDVYACDTTGLAPYNDFLGEIRIETLYPTSNVSVTWTPLANTNWQEVSEHNMDSDTSYNSKGSSGIDTFGISGLSSTPTTIFATAVISSARKDDVKGLQYRNKLISGGTTTDGSTSALATVYQYVRDTYLTDPDTSAAWIGAGVGAVNIGYERF